MICYMVGVNKALLMYYMFLHMSNRHGQCITCSGDPFLILLNSGNNICIILAIMFRGFNISNNIPAIA